MVFGLFRDIVRCFEGEDHGSIVHRNLGLGITVPGVDHRHLEDTRKIDPDARLLLVVSFKIIAQTP
jgi:hypothetical protein